MNRFILLIVTFFTTLLIISCGNKNQFDVDIKSVPLKKLEIKRYEKAMFAIPADSFLMKVPTLSAEFPVFFDGDISDTSALLALKSFFIDPHMQELNELVSSKYADIYSIQQDLVKSFRYLNYHFPMLPTPEVYTYISGLDFKFPSKFINGSLLLGLDMYLGANTKPYEVSGFPKYRNKWAISECIVPDAMGELAAGLLPPIKNDDDLLRQMIYKGKILYFVHALMPDISDTVLFKYSETQLEWVSKHQAEIWAYLLENQLLYTKDKRILRKFTDDGPFTDLFSKSSPPRLAEYIGYQIVYNYMVESGESIPKLFNENQEQKILKISRYKPKL